METIGIIKGLYKAVPPIWYYYISGRMFTIRGGGVDFCLLVGVDLPHSHFQSRSNVVLPDTCFRQRVRSYSVNLGSLDFYAPGRAPSIRAICEVPATSISGSVSAAMQNQVPKAVSHTCK